MLPKGFQQTQPRHNPATKPPQQIGTSHVRTRNERRSVCGCVRTYTLALVIPTLCLIRLKSLARARPTSKNKRQCRTSHRTTSLRRHARNKKAPGIKITGSCRYWLRKSTPQKRTNIHTQNRIHARMLQTILTPQWNMTADVLAGSG